MTTGEAPERPFPPSAWGAEPLSAEAQFEAGVAYCGRFFMGQSEADLSLGKLTGILEAEGLPYAIIGAFALNEYGHQRVTVDVDLVMREADLQESKRVAPHRAKDPARASGGGGAPSRLGQATPITRAFQTTRSEHP